MSDAVKVSAGEFEVALINVVFYARSIGPTKQFTDANSGIVYGYSTPDGYYLERWFYNKLTRK
jgi:hypothetical protein